MVKRKLQVGGDEYFVMKRHRVFFFHPIHFFFNVTWVWFYLEDAEKSLFIFILDQ